MRQAWIGLTLLSSLFSGCGESKLESTPSTVDRRSADAKVVDETVSPPVPITGAYLKAVLINESSGTDSATVRVGITCYYDGIRTSTARDRFKVTFAVSHVGTGSITVAAEAQRGTDYDQIVSITGANLNAVRSSYPNLDLSMTVLDQSNSSTDTLEISVSSALAGLSEGQVKSGAGTPGSPGQPGAAAP